MAAGVAHVLGALLRRHGDLADCEDAAQEALEAAARQWPREGRPDSPRGWLVRVASRRLVDQVRAERARTAREERVATAAPEEAWTAPAADAEPAAPPDDPLELVLLCCHPALSRSSQVALTLRAVSGLSTAEIATAFLVPEATMAQRLSRARATLRAAGARFERPTPGELPDRVAAVLDVLHLLFTEGSTRSSGTAVVDQTLTAEALRLTRRLRALLPDHDEVGGALALMLLTGARHAARTDDRGDLVPLAEQDRRRWDAAAVVEGVRLLEEVLPRGHVGRYQLQAAIAAVHAEAPSWEATDWRQICCSTRCSTGWPRAPPSPSTGRSPRRWRSAPSTGWRCCRPSPTTRRCAGTTASSPSGRTCGRRAGDREGAARTTRRPPG